MLTLITFGIDNVTDTDGAIDIDIAIDIDLNIGIGSYVEMLTNHRCEC